MGCKVSSRRHQSVGKAGSELAAICAGLERERDACIGLMALVMEEKGEPRPSRERLHRELEDVSALLANIVKLEPREDRTLANRMALLHDRLTDIGVHVRRFQDDSVASLRERITRLRKEIARALFAQQPL